MYGFYQEVYGGTAIEAEEFPQLWARANDTLARFGKLFSVEGDEKARSMALCAMAETQAWFDAAQNGTGGLRYASVGTVSVSGKGVYGTVDISPAALEKELYRCACRYLDIKRGREGVCVF